MSKKLIIKDADFAVNGILNIGFELTNVFEYEAKNFIRASTTTKNYYFPSPAYQAPRIAGKTIYGIRVRTVGAGNFDFLKLEGYSTNPNGINSGTVTTIATYKGTSGKIKTILFDNPIIVPDTGDVSFGLRCNGTAIYFLNNTPPYLYYLGSPTGRWADTTAFGGGLELLIAAEDIEE